MASGVIMDRGVWIPRDSGLPLAKLKSRFVVSYFRPGDEESREIRTYKLTNTHLLLPRAEGLKLISNFGVKAFNRVADYRGYARISPDVGAPKLRQYQGPVVEKALVAMSTRGSDFCIKAHTGSGKTIMGMEIARRSGYVPLVVVDNNIIKDGWIKAATEVFGIPEDRIGIVQGDNFDYEDKDIVIAMVQTLYRRAPLPKAFRWHFGVVFFDECHRVAAPRLSKVLFETAAKHRIGLSATPNRKDALTKVLRAHLGPVRITLEKEHTQSVVRVVEYRGNCYSWYANVSPKTGRFINEVAADGERNMVLVGILKELYENGRTILAIGERVVHLENLIALCRLHGIPDEDMGLVSAKQTCWRYAKDPKPPRKPEGLWSDDYTPVHVALVESRRRKRDNDAVLANARIIFATYSIFSTGADVERLSAGVECTPRSGIAQSHGRILRTAKGKLTPIWVTIRDTRSYRAEYQLSQRLKQYVKDSNAEVQRWKLHKGVKRVDPRELARNVEKHRQKLKNARIETRFDGNCTVLTGLTGIR